MHIYFHENPKQAEQCFIPASIQFHTFDYEDEGDMFLPKRRLTFDGLYCVISQKTKVFMTTAVRTSNPNNSSVSTNSVACTAVAMQRLRKGRKSKGRLWATAQ
jgi:hypothetical protein